MGVSEGFQLGPDDRRVGVLGGTFDPVHYGHLVVAEEVRELLSLDRVVFVPAASPPHKRGIAISPVQDRAAMVEIAIAGNPTFAMSRIEMNREGPSYTADTLALFAAEADRQKAVRELFFILSAEALALLPEWHEPRRVLELAHLVVVPRPGSPVPAPAEIGARFGDQAGRVLAVDTLPLAHSASDIRRRAAAGRTIRYLVPPAVEAYICDHHLYRSADAGSAANEDRAK
jgi:nicotinate-nucleotide adenylyltransferase